MTDTYDLDIPRPDFLGGKHWALRRLTPITIIFGKNGSGKSILLRQIRDMSSELHHYCAPERGGNFAYDLNMIPSESGGKTRVHGTQQNLVPDFRTRVFSRLAAYLTKRGSSRRKIDANALDKIEEIINRLLTDFRFHIDDGHPPHSLERISTGEKIASVDSLSSGEIQLLTLSLDLLLVNEMWKLEDKKGILLIDEPDSHFHPDMQQRFSKFLLNLNLEYGCSIIIATHSTTLLSALGHHGGPRTSVIYLTSGKDEYNATPFSNVLKVLTTCLGGHALMGPLFNYPILLVEGDDDYRLWSEIPRHGKLQLAVIPCNGDEIFEYQKTLERIFESIIDKKDTPSGYALLDGDYGQPQSAQTFIKFLKLSCHESENLYLTNEVLESLGYDWNSAGKKIVDESNNYGQKSNELKTVTSLDRKTGDCKNIINQIAQILDSKRLPWSFRLGKVMGEKRPEGQLADFLGPDLIKALWE